jgi:transcription elongation factor GreA
MLRRIALFMSPATAEGAAAVARYDLNILDGRIKQLTDLMERVRVIPEPPDDRAVRIGSRVRVRYDDNTEDTLTIVGPYEADPSKGQVSSESPAGQALLGKAVGDRVTAGSGDDSLALMVVSIGKQDAPGSDDAPAMQGG